MPLHVLYGKVRWWLYPITVITIYLVWTSYMTFADRWHLFTYRWPMALTMVLGSFVAGATAEGGAAVAFPVFTKLLHIPAPEARTFGLMIQSMGMTTAALFIVTRGIRILPDVITWVSIGGVFGMFLGSYVVTIPSPYSKLLFTFVTAAFGVTLLISRWVLNWHPLQSFVVGDWQRRSLFFCIGVAGGTFAANTGSGIDTLTFIVLTLAFGVDEKISTPTTVVIMGLNTVMGFFIHGALKQDIGIIWEYWLVAMPVVVLGAPLGAWVASKVSRDAVILFLLSLITLELITTILLIPFTPATLLFTASTVTLCTIWFAVMLGYRQRYGKSLPAHDLFFSNEQVISEPQA